MICYKCKVNLPDHSKFCPRCGEVFPSDIIKNLVISPEEELLDIYLDESKDLERNISRKALFFNFSYAFAKKLYFQGIIWEGIDIILIKLLLGSISTIINSLGFYFLLLVFAIDLCIVINIYYIKNFNEIYINHVRCKVQKMYKLNGLKTMEKLKKKCYSDRKNNYFAMILSLIIFIILAFLQIKY